MVFETQVGETFLLGASTWRIEEITHDRVLVTPAPGEPGKMPFWHGDRAGRPVASQLRHRQPGARVATPRRRAGDRLCGSTTSTRRRPRTCSPISTIRPRRAVFQTTARSSSNAAATSSGDWRVCLLSPFGSRIHAPWAMAVTAQIRNRTGMDVEVMWGDEGFVVRFPEVEQPPDPRSASRP